MTRSHVVRPEITTLRGIACVALVAYHVIGPTSVSGMHLPDSSLWHHAMNALDFLRMPIFAVIAGYVYASRRVDRASLGRFIKGKFMRLAIPLVFMTAVMVALRYAAYGDAISLATALTSHYQHLWFLQSLLIIFVLIALCDSFARLSSKGLAVVALTTLAVSESLTFPNTLSLNGVVYLAPLFLFGIVLREEPALLGKPQIRVGIWFVAVGLLLQQAAPLLGGAEVPRSSLAAALCGCGAAYVLVATCPRIALFEKVGAYSYTIYLWHSVAAAAARETLEHFVALPTVVAFTVLMAIGIIVPIAIHLSVRHIPVLATLMAGLRSPSVPSSASSKFAEPRVGVLLARSANDNSAGTSRAPSGQARTR